MGCKMRRDITLLVWGTFILHATVMAFEGQLQRLLYYTGAERPLKRRTIHDLQPVLDSKDTVLVPLLDTNKVFVREIMPESFELIYLNGGSSLKVDDGNRYIYLGELDSLQYIACEFKNAEVATRQLPKSQDEGVITHRPLREVSEKINDNDAVSIAAQAVGFNTWHARTKHCAKCGSSLCSEKGGMVLRCTNEDCKASSYPRIEPATMNFITDETNRYTLLGRKAAWPDMRYSCLAGFLEIGESLEQCVMRETVEESGILLYVIR